MKWPWMRSRPEPQCSWSPPDPVPDYDTVFPRGYDRAARDWLTEPTMALPTYRPLLTPGQAARSSRSTR